jgi:hypothetical protein
MQSVSRKVAVACGLTHYFTGKPCHKGHINFRFTKTGHCLDCATERNRSAEKVEYRKHYKQSNYEKILAKNRALYAQKPQKYRAYNRRYQQEHAEVLRPKNANRTMLRIAAKQQRTPKWLSADDLWLMEEAYALAALRTKVTGIAWDVDHIVPLRGKVVSGLHVPWNIQVLPAAINRSKGNKFNNHAIA